jgi:hypothetical protein
LDGTWMDIDQSEDIILISINLWILRRRLSSKKRSTWARKWLRRRRWDVFLWSLLYLQSFHSSKFLASCIHKLEFKFSWSKFSWMETWMQNLNRVYRD